MWRSGQSNHKDAINSSGKWEKSDLHKTGNRNDSYLYRIFHISTKIHVQLRLDFRII